MWCISNIHRSELGLMHNNNVVISLKCSQLIEGLMLLVHLVCVIVWN